MQLKILKTYEEYKQACKRLALLFNSPINSPEREELEVLKLLVKKYENEHYKIEAPDPVELIKIRMEELDLKQKDLVGVIGSKSRVSEVLNRKRKLSIEMIRNLATTLHLPASALIQDYPLATEK